MMTIPHAEHQEYAKRLVRATYATGSKGFDSRYMYGGNAETCMFAVLRAIAELGREHRSKETKTEGGAK